MAAISNRITAEAFLKGVDDALGEAFPGRVYARLRGGIASNIRPLVLEEGESADRIQLTSKKVEEIFGDIFTTLQQLHDLEQNPDASFFLTDHAYEAAKEAFRNMQTRIQPKQASLDKTFLDEVLYEGIDVHAKELVEHFVDEAKRTAKTDDAFVSHVERRLCEVRFPDQTTFQYSSLDKVSCDRLLRGCMAFRLKHNLLQEVPQMEEGDLNPFLKDYQEAARNRFGRYASGPSFTTVSRTIQSAANLGGPRQILETTFGRFGQYYVRHQLNRANGEKKHPFLAEPAYQSARQAVIDMYQKYYSCFIDSESGVEEKKDH